MKDECENPLQEKKQHIFRERETRWKNKVLHGKWVKTINNTCAQTSEWLRTAHLKVTVDLRGVFWGKQYSALCINGKYINLYIIAELI